MKIHNDQFAGSGKVFFFSPFFFLKRGKVGGKKLGKGGWEELNE